MRQHRLHRLVLHHRSRLMLAVRGTVAALAALAAAVSLQLECPYWAAMTALIVIQPTRGLLLEKSFYRLVGTAIGSAAGLTMLLSARSPALLTLLLSLWLAGCVGTGNVLYGLRSYGALIAGCTGAVVAMAGYSNPPHLHDLAFGRIACIIIGIIVSTTVTLCFTQRRSKRELLDRLTRVAVADIQWLALVLSGEREKDLLALRQDILVEIAEIEGALDAVWAGSLDLKKRKRRIRSLVVSLLSLLEAGKSAGDHLARQCGEDFGRDCWREPFARHLEEVARCLHEYGSIRPAAVKLSAVLTEAQACHPRLGETLGELVNSLQLVIDEWDATAPDIERPAGKTFISHRDWQEAGRAALRAAFAIAAAGAAWTATGWREGPLMLMAVSIMVSIFSTHDRPTVTLTHILCGASLGVASAFLCRLVLLPGLSGPVLQGAVSIPFLMAGIIALSHPRTALGAMDAMLFFLFVMQPGLPAVPAPPAFVAGGFAVLGGIGVAILSFRFLLPIDPGRRLRSLLVAIAGDLVRMAAADSPAVAAKGRARTHHRFLRLLVNARKSDNDLSAVVEGGLAALAIGRLMERLRETGMHEVIPPAALAAVRETARRLSVAIQRPEEIPAVLAEASVVLATAVDPNGVARTAPVRAAFPAVHGAQVFPGGNVACWEEARQCPI